MDTVARELAPARLRSSRKTSEYGVSEYLRLLLEWGRCAAQREQAPSPQEPAPFIRFIVSGSTRDVRIRRYADGSARSSGRSARCADRLSVRRSAPGTTCVPPQQSRRRPAWDDAGLAGRGRSSLPGC